MKAVLLAGGLGTRIAEETGTRPKPMVEIGGKPLLWHLMKFYSSFGVNEFIVCLGYKGYFIKEYFANYFLHMSDVTIDVAQNTMVVHEQHAEPWRVTLVDSGETTATGGRLKRVGPYIEGEQEVFFTYGDGLSNVDLTSLLATHRLSGKLVTVTAVRPPGRYGSLGLDESDVITFEEKPPGDGGWINGGFFVVSPEVLSIVSGDSTSWEVDVLPDLVARGELSAFPHRGFWQPMDTLRDKNILEAHWETGAAPWKLWS